MKLTNARQLKWDAVREAAQEIERITNNAAFVPPEDLHRARDLIVRVCHQLEVITKSLLITPPGGTP